MQNHTLLNVFTPQNQTFQNSIPIHQFSNPYHTTPFNCRSPNFTPIPPNRSCAHPSPKFRSLGTKNVDVSTLGNLCVDIVLNVYKLPSHSIDDRKDYMDQLSSSPPHTQHWEAGGNCNMALAAARLGLHCITIGHVGNEGYGNFLLDVLHNEGINFIPMSEDTHITNSSSSSYKTLLCWVLVDPLQRHEFCSQANFSKEPAFNWLGKLSVKAKIAIKQSKVLFCNGYGFDELSPGLILSSLEYAIEVGTSIFFDPGPRGKSFLTGTPEEQRAFNYMLRMSNVLLLTSDEAESLTGIKNPILAGQNLLSSGVRTQWVIVKLGSRGSMLITLSSIACVPSFKVNVVDTVGCGDSFVAAIAFGFIRNMPLVNTLAVANAVGGATAMGRGAGRNVANLKQVLNIIKASNINEDDEFWNDLLDENIKAQEISILSNAAINGKGIRHVALQNVASQLLSELESVEGTTELEPIQQSRFNSKLVRIGL